MYHNATLTFVACSRKPALSSLHLMVVPKRDDLQVMSVRRDTDAGTIEMTGEGLRLLSKRSRLGLTERRILAFHYAIPA